MENLRMKVNIDKTTVMIVNEKPRDDKVIKCKDVTLEKEAAYEYLERVESILTDK